STWWTVPRITCPRFSSRFASRPWPTPSGWNPMHQQPPQTPLLASTSAAKSSQVSGVSIRVVNVTPIVCLGQADRRSGVAAGQDAELVPLRVGEGDPALFAGLADVGVPGT